MRDLAKQVVQGAKSVFGPTPEDDVITLIVARAVKAGDPSGYAFKAGRNRAIDAMRREACARVRQAHNEAMDAIDATIASVKGAAEARCTAELEAILARLASGRTPGRMSDHLLTIEAAYLEGIALRTLYPGVPAATLYQWKRRGLKLVLPHASQELSYWLDRQVPCEV